MSVPNRIAELRKGRNLSRQKMAEMVGTSVEQVRRLEVGERRLSDVWIERIAAALDIPPQELISESRLPTEDELQKMIDLALREVPIGATREDQLRIVASNLRVQLEHYRAADVE